MQDLFNIEPLKTPTTLGAGMHSSSALVQLNMAICRFKEGKSLWKKLTVPF